MVGPPSEVLNCFDAMKLRIQWSAAESPALSVELFIRVVAPRNRHVRCSPEQCRRGRLRGEQNLCFSKGRLGPGARRLWPKEECG